MEYTDYETGKPISRAQFIANGLERGELVVDMDCGCTVIQDRTADAYIVYCNLHGEAPKLYDALKMYVGLCGNTAYLVDRIGLRLAWDKATDALANADRE